jgi:hypothetical protein
MIESQSQESRTPWWLATIVIIGALLMAAGGIIALVKPAMLLGPYEVINGATRVYAGYLVSRNIALAAMLLFMLAIRARGVLSSLMVLTAFIQLLDADMDILEGRWALVPGVLIYAIAFLVGAARLDRPFWKAAVWRDSQ